MNRKSLALIVMSILIIVSVTGCGLLDKMLSIKEDFQKEKKVEENSSGEPRLEMDEIIIDTPDLEEPVIVSPPAETKDVILYFVSADGKNLVEVEHKIGKVEGVARATINALLEGPDFQSGLLPSVPVGTRLLDINVKDDGLCIVDFSSDIIANMSGGAEGEKLAVYAITNTLCQFPTVDRVEFRVEGQRMDSLLGYTNLEPAVTADASLVIN